MGRKGGRNNGSLIRCAAFPVQAQPAVQFSGRAHHEPICIRGGDLFTLVCEDAGEGDQAAGTEQSLKGGGKGDQRCRQDVGDQHVGDRVRAVFRQIGVETIGELEVLGYIEKIAAGDKSVLLIDSRTPDWAAKGTIPGAINVPWTRLNPSKGADPISITEILTNLFGARDLEGLWDFDDAKTLVLFCNGMWCGQSPNNIQNLLRFGYPAHKIKWYRGGMQDWEILGLTTVKP